MNFREDLREGLIAILKSERRKAGSTWDLEQVCFAFCSYRGRMIPPCRREVRSTAWSHACGGRRPLPHSCRH